MVAIDATTLLLFLRPATPGPRDAANKPVARVHERIDLLKARLEREDSRIVIPTPALSEVLVRARSVKDSQDIIDELKRTAVFIIHAFDELSAIEVAEMARKEPKPKNRAETYAKLKYDRQIVAIAKVCGASEIYSEDDGVERAAALVNIPVVRVRDLPLPPVKPQLDAFERRGQK
jgi:predicted nucleic acid-binding protein